MMPVGGVGDICQESHPNSRGSCQSKEAGAADGAQIGRKFQKFEKSEMFARPPAPMTGVVAKLSKA